VTHFGLDLGVLGAGKGRWALVERPFFTGTWFKVFLAPNSLIVTRTRNQLAEVGAHLELGM
jgi:hypothetical protein